MQMVDEKKIERRKITKKGKHTFPHNLHIPKEKKKRQKARKKLRAGEGKAEPAPESKVPRHFPAAMSGAQLPSSFSYISILLAVSPQYSSSNASTH